MSKILVKYLIFILLINFILNDNITISSDKIILDNPDIKLNINKNITENVNKNNTKKNISNISDMGLNILNINKNNITKLEPKKNMNITIYDKNKILEILTNNSPNGTKAGNNTTSKNGNIIDDDEINRMEDVQNIIIQNTHEDQLAESLFYFLCFVLIIFIILFLYKFYKCYCQNTIKEFGFGEEGNITNPNNDPELQRISTHDEENIMDITQN